MWNACIVRRDKQRKKKRKTWKRRRHEETSGTLKHHLLVASSPWDVFSLATTHWTWSLGSLSGLFVLRYLPIWLCGAPRHVAADRRTFSRRDSMNFRKQELDMVQEQNKETRKETTYKNKKRLRKRLIKRLRKRLVNSYKLLHLSPPSRSCCLPLYLLCPSLHPRPNRYWSLPTSAMSRARTEAVPYYTTLFHKFSRPAHDFSRDFARPSLRNPPARSRVFLYISSRCGNPNIHIHRHS